MADHRFDTLAEEFASGLSRREVITAAVAAAVGIKLRAGTSSPAAARTLARRSSCSTCKFDTHTSKFSCGRCTDAAKAAAVSRQAAHSADVRRLRKYLTAHRFKTHGSNQTLVLHQDGKWLRSMVAYTFRLSVAHESATIFFGLEASQHSAAFAVVSRDKKVLYGLQVSKAGHVVRVNPPHGHSGSAPARSDAITQGPSGPINSCQPCDAVCNFALALPACAIVGAVVCSFTGPGVILCALSVGTACGAPTYLACQLACTRICKCGEDEYLCGLTCCKCHCPPSEFCCPNGGCCPSGADFTCCGSECCPKGRKCCDNKYCYDPTEYFCCGDGSGSTCEKGNGEFCCSGKTTWCCTPGTFCCEAQGGGQCCLTGSDVCCPGTEIGCYSEKCP